MKINYKLYSRRRRISLKSVIEKEGLHSYKAVCEYFGDKGVSAPDKEEYAAATVVLRKPSAKKTVKKNPASVSPKVSRSGPQKGKAISRAKKRIAK